jgi:phosphoserine phosphatase RsbU/P
MTTLTRSVALLMDAIEDDYQAAIVRGVLRVSGQANVQLRCIAGGVLGDGKKDVRSQKNFLFELLEPSTLHGVLALSGALGNQLGASAFGRWLRRYESGPLVHLGIELPGLHGITVDGGAGMRAVVQHLIQVHGHKNIAFIRGPTSSAEAEERYAAYCQVLAENELPYDERLVVQGTWLRESGADAVRELFDKRRLHVERVAAIVAANDYMALGALAELTARDIAVPETIALTGFDDLDTLRGVVPPLTTVRQPTEELGVAGYHRLASLMNRNDEPISSKLAPALIERRSCGCSDGPVHPTRRPPQQARTFEAALVERRTLICAELVRSARGRLFCLGSGWETKLFAALLSDVTRQAPGTFAGALGGVLIKLRRHNADPALLQPVLERLRQGVYDCAASDAAALARAIDLFDDGREAIAEFLLRAQVQRRIDVLHQLREFSAATALLLAGPSLSLVQGALNERFSALGLGAFSLGLFTESGRVTEECLCLAAFNDSKREPAPARFRSRDFCPPALFAHEQRPLLIQPLIFAGEPLGIVTCVLGSLENNVYEQLREVLSAGLQGYRLASAAHSGQIASRQSSQA